jgi:hypothetical protein
VHVILESSVDKLTTSEHETVDKLVNTMDILTEQLDKHNNIDPLMINSVIKADIALSDPLDIKKQGSKIAS